MSRGKTEACSFKVSWQGNREPIKLPKVEARASGIQSYLHDIYRVLKK